MDEMRILRDQVYRTVQGRDLLLDLYLPAAATGPWPAIVWVHGGAWRTGDRRQGVAALRMVGRGYAVASISYRLSQEALFPAQIQDCKAAVRWLRAHAAQHGIDPARIGAWGPSAGGHLVALLGTAAGVPELEGDGPYQEFSSAVQAVCDWFGPTDFLQMDAQGSAQHHDAPDSPESQLVGGPIQERQAEVARANPISYLRRGAIVPPFLIMHGDQDPLVPYQQSVLLYAALQRESADVTLHLLPGAGHGGPAFETAQVVAIVDAFFGRMATG